MELPDFSPIIRYLLQAKSLSSLIFSTTAIIDPLFGTNLTIEQDF